MDMYTLSTYCKTKKGAYEDYPFGPEPLTFKVSSKIFALITYKPGRITVSLKCDPFLAQNLRQQYIAVTPGYHLNKEHWNTIVLDGSIPDSEISWMIDHSYDLVVKRLAREERSKLFG